MATDFYLLGERKIVNANASNLIILGGYMNGSGKMTYRRPNDTAGYLVPSANGLSIVGYQINATVAGGASVQLGYCDTDIGFNSASALVNPIYQFGDANYCFYRNPGVAGSGPNPGISSAGAIAFLVPLNKYVMSTYSGANFVDITLFAYLL